MKPLNSHSKHSAFFYYRLLISLTIFLHSIVANAALTINKISTGEYHTCAIIEGEGKCWGKNDHGQVGDGTTTNRLLPVSIDHPYSNLLDIAAGKFHTCTVANDNSLQCWGMNDKGQLGDGTTSEYHEPNQIVGVTNATQITTSGSHTCAIINGAVQCWGDNCFGQLGNNSTVNSSTPVHVNGLVGTIKQIALGDFHSCALIENGNNEIWCWGGNGQGQIGDGSIIHRRIPVKINSITDAVEITAGSAHTCALTSSGGVKCWGSNLSGQLGNGLADSIDKSSPVDVVGLATGVTQISAGNSHSCALMTDGTAKCWGANGSGQIGVGTTISSYSNPAAVLFLNHIDAIIAGGYHTCALINHQTELSCWGSNGNGQLGDGTTKQKRIAPIVINWPLEMRIQGGTPAINISNGDDTPESIDGTDFGIVQVGNSTSRTFLIRNFGSDPLTLTASPSVGVTVNSGFSVTNSPNSIILAGETVSFTLQFTPTTAGIFSAVVSVESSNSGVSPYYFTIQGVGAMTLSTGMSVEGGSPPVTILNGDQVADSSDGTQFGTVATNQVISKTFTIKNVGSTTLNLTGSPAVIVTSLAGNGFAITSQPSSSIAAGGSTTFTVQFTTSTEETSTAEISIASNDSSTSPYNFFVQGTGVNPSPPPVPEPEIVILGGTTNIVVHSGDTTPDNADGTDLGTVTINGTLSSSFEIHNSGVNQLILSSLPTISGTGFSLTSPPSLQIPGGSSTYFTVQFSPQTAGLATATISIASNDTATNPYIFTVQGNGENGGNNGENDSNSGGNGSNNGNSSNNGKGQVGNGCGITPTILPNFIDVIVKFGGQGSGRVISQPTKLDCHSSSKKECKVAFRSIEPLVKLVPIADKGSAFYGWSGCYTGTLIFDKAGPFVCTANFGTLPQTAAKPVIENRLLSVSARGYADNDPVKQLIAGILVQGAEEKELAIRAFGRGFNDKLDSQLNPYFIIRNFPDAQEIARNQDWRTDKNHLDLQQLGQNPYNDEDAATIVNLSEGLYTVQLRPESVADIGLVDIIDLNPDTSSKLKQFSARAHVDNNPVNYLYAGIYVQGKIKLAVLGIGRGMENYDVHSQLNARIEIHTYPEGKIVANNDDWQDNNPHANSLTQLNLSPPHASDAGLVVELTEGYYTIELIPQDQATGVGMVNLMILE